MSGGEKHILTIARTMMVNPEVLLLDELSEGLAPLVVEMLEEQLASLKAPIGKHARSAVGMAELPFNISVEIEMIAEVA